MILVALLLAIGAFDARTDGSDPKAPARPLPVPGSPEWVPIEFSGIQRHTRYDPVDVDGVRALRAESRCSASALALSLTDFDLRETPRLAWRWRIERELDVENEGTRAGDDFAARVYVTFPFDPAKASFWERVRRRMAERLQPYPIPGKALAYVWASRAAPGSRWPSPASPRDVTLLVKRSGADKEWRREVVDVAADFRGVFGTEAPAPQSLVLMNDSDDTCGHAVAYFAEVRFLGPEVSR